MDRRRQTKPHPPLYRISFKEDNLSNALQDKYLNSSRNTLLDETEASESSEVQPSKNISGDELKHLEDDILYDFHTLSKGKLKQRLQTDFSKGLTSTEAQRRLKENGPNILKTKKPSVILRFLGYLIGGFGVILWVASLLCFLAWKPLGDPPDRDNLILAIVLLCCIAIQAGFNWYQDFKSSSVMNSIKKMLPATTIVIRDEIKQQVAVADLVVGDVVILTIGNRVPADLRLIDVQNMKQDSAAMTGESEPVNSTVSCTSENFMESKNLCFLGSSIIQGNGIGVVIKAGSDTVMGQIAKMASTDKTELAHIQVEIRRFVIVISSLAIATGLLLLLLWGVWLKKSYPHFLSLSSILTNCIGAIVAFVPEGLPISVALALTIIAKKLYNQHVLVKHLPHIETLGSVDTVCSDKTGTLTQNKMTVVNFTLNGKNYSSEDARQMYEQSTPAFLSFYDVISLCNRASYDKADKDEIVPADNPKIIGDATDSALLVFAQRFRDVDKYRDTFRKVAEIPFNSINKYALCLFAPENEEDDNINLFMKGAPEYMFERCKTYLTLEGNEVRFSKKMKKKEMKLQEKMGSEGKRVLGLCRSTISAKKYQVFAKDFDPATANLPLKKLCFVGMVSLMDPPRPEVSSVINECHAAGIRVCMVTGDHPTTALAIAKMVGIVTKPLTHTLQDMENDDIYIHLKQSAKNYNKEDNTKKILCCKRTKEEIEDIEMGLMHKNNAVKLGVSVTNDTHSLLLTGSDLSNPLMLSSASWSWCLNYHSEIVFSRTSPEQKLKIVQEFKKRGHIVAVTGDGINDSPALKTAQSGVAMGSGSDVAIQAADIVLMDSNFQSLVVGIKYGRLVFENLRKVILYLLPAGSWSELLPVLANVILGLPLPLSAFLMIVICVGTDIMPSLSLIYEKPEADLMARPPRNPKKIKMVDTYLFLHAYLFLGMIEATCSFIMYFWYMYHAGGFVPSDLFLAYDKWSAGFKGKTQDQLNEILYGAQTAYFVCLVTMQFGNVLSTRTRHRSFFHHDPISAKSRNLFVFGAILISLCIMLLLTLIPGLQNTFNTRNLPIQFWLLPYGFALLLFSCDEIRKLIIRRYTERKKNL